MSKIGRAFVRIRPRTTMIVPESTTLLSVEPYGVSDRACEMHEHHRPAPTYCELHHIIPRAWQYAWHPGDPAIETDDAKPKLGHTDLFDRRTMVLCPTDHRNVHFWLERLMRQWQKNPDLRSAVGEVTKWAHHSHTPFSQRAMNVAVLGMNRWVDAGGDLSALVAIGLYGQI